ncbi:MAG: glycosyltransferase family 2 protein [Saprospiraceae bacterium]|nr:glycosyltransferase family 2 protein [Bacteroidia bacterium]NNE13519.1 glycosyltransferase family 2 protein [Saprospiraceae bacterium]NNL91167.1 glycosyltransferase family 2 protein [Saprospiraceae bacterium]
MSYKISVIVCTYNRERFIKDCLDHLFNQTLDKQLFEVILVNNNCTDNTKQIVDQYALDNPSLNLRQVIETNQGLSFARNRGIKEAQSDLICYIDDDGMASKDYLEKIISYFNDNVSVIGIGGKVIPIYETEEPLWYNDFLRMMVTRIDFGDKVFKCYGKKYPAGCSMIYKKEWLEKAGGFNNALKWRADDKYIFNAISKYNDEIYYYPKISVGHHIDAQRLTDENFDKLSRLLGSEERLRILSNKKYAFLPKLGEFIFKYFATYLIAFYYLLKGQWIKGKYVIRFRWLALLGYLNL